MVKNYLLTAFRSFRKNQLFTLINVSGLALSVAAVVVIVLFARNELTYDGHHTNRENIYMVYKERITPNGTQPTYDTWVPLAGELRTQYPEIKNSARVFQSNEVVMVNEERFDEDVYYADPEYFQLFDFPLVKGSNDKPLPNNSSVVISEEMATKLFGDIDPMGETIIVNYETSYTVSGIMKDYPANTFISSDIIIPIEGHPEYEDVEREWGGSFLFTYILLEEAGDPMALEEKFPALIRNIWDEETEKRTKFRLLPLRDHYDVFVGDSSDSYLLLYIALGIIIIAGINFMNLSTARSMERAKEIAMRKVIGAGYLQLITQFLAEAIILSFAGLGVGLLLAEFIIPYVNSSFGMQLSIPYGNPETILLLLGFGLMLGFFAGSYPAFVLSKIKILTSLKGKMFAGKGGYIVRNVLVVFQFSLSLALIIGSLIVANQIWYMKDSDLAFDKENLMVIPLRVGDFQDAEEAIPRIQTFKNEIESHSAVVEISASRHIPGRWSGSNLFVRPEGWEGDPMRMRYTYHDASFFQTYGIELLEGDGFLPDENGDQRESAVLNQAAMEAFGWTDVIDKAIIIGSRQIEIVGLIKDFNFETLRQDVDPIIHFHRVSSNAVHSYVTVKIQPGNEVAVRDFIKGKWDLLDADREFSYFYIEEEMKSLYAGEDRLLAVVTGFMILSIVISCLGLFGLSAFLINKKRKEIGIRKVLGARTVGLTMYFSGSYLRLILVAFIISAPVAYWLMENWLAEFAFRQNQNLLFYFGGLLLLLLVAGITVASRTILAASANPVTTLRDE